MILLDTNVISEPLRPRPSPVAMNFLLGGNPSTQFISAISLQELYYGAWLQAGKDKFEPLMNSIRQIQLKMFAGRTLDFDASAAEVCGKLQASRKHTGSKFINADIQIAAIALSRGFTLATRNIADFQFDGLKLVNPWAE